nr:hypothetical protein BaRGS_002134 [Batillaria attramentaria]
MSSLADWGEAGKKYTIHPATLSFFEKTKTLGLRGYEECSLEEFRASALRRTELFAGHADFTGSDIEYIVPCEGNEVVNVEYRLAPEHKAPAAFDDCRAVARWVLQNKTLIGHTTAEGGGAESQVGIGGDSAGGQLTACVSQDVKGLAFQILVYPVTDLSLTAPSYAEFYDTPGLNTKSMEWFIKQFLANEDQRKDPVVCPCLRPSFKGLPPALVIIAELDPLRDDGLAYAEKLKEAGVPTELLLVRGAAHAFFHMHAGVPVSVYKPADVSRVPAIWIYFHGGGLVIGSRNLFQPALTKLASLARCIIVNVEYRLAPEHKAPAAFDDCRAVAHWVLQNKTLIGLLVETVKVRLIQLFLVSEDQRKDPVVCPCLRPSFKGLPPALVIIAELDPLRDDGLAYAEKLKEAGVPTELLLVKGAAHGGFHLPGYFTQITQEIYDCIVEFLIRFQKD